MGKHIHRLSNIDATLQTATCAECGDVRIRKKVNTWRCVRGAYAHNIKPHGLTNAQANAFTKDKRCEICGSTDSLAVDHDHLSNTVRGVLCKRCNSGLGLFQESTKKLASAIRYLNSHTVSIGLRTR